MSLPKKLPIKSFFLQIRITLRSVTWAKKVVFRSKGICAGGGGGEEEGNGHFWRKPFPRLVDNTQKEESAKIWEKKIKVIQEMIAYNRSPKFLKVILIAPLG